MIDPFQNVAAAPPGMIDMFVGILEKRGRDPEMVAIVEDYLDALDPEGRGAIVEIGCGTGAVLRRIAAKFPKVKVMGVDASAPLITAGGDLAGDIANLSLGVEDGAKLSMADGMAGSVLMHSLLTHVPDPGPFLAEAARILAPGGRLVVCDADFSKISLALDDHDPLDACAQFFADEFVADKRLIAKLRPQLVSAGLAVERFSIANRLDFAEGSGQGWVAMASKVMESRGLIGHEMAEGLRAEYARRARVRENYGFLPFVTVVARKPF